MSEPADNAGDVEAPSAEQENVEHHHGNLAQEPPPPTEENPPTTPVDPIAQEIQRLESETDCAREQKVKAESKFLDRQNRLTALQAVQRDIDTTLTAYRAAYGRLAREAKAIEEFLKCEKESLRKRLGEDGVEQVRQLSDARAAMGETLKKQALDAEASLQQAEADRDDRKKDVKKRGEELSEWKKLTATITARQTELRTMRDEVTSATQAGQDGVAYWLLGCAEDKYDSFAQDPRLIKPDEVPQALLRAVQNLADAEKSYAEAERAVAIAKDDRVAAVKEWDRHEKESEAELRDALRQIPGAEPVTTGERSHA